MEIGNRSIQEIERRDPDARFDGFVVIIDRHTTPLRHWKSMRVTDLEQDKSVR